MSVNPSSSATTLPSRGGRAANQDAVNVRAHEMFGELRPFYSLAWVAVVTAWLMISLSIAPILLLNGESRPGLLGGLVVVLFLAIALLAAGIQYNARRRQGNMLRRALAGETPRLRAALVPFLELLRDATSDRRVSLVVVHEPGSLAWTLSAYGTSAPVVVITTGLWAQRTRKDMDVVVLHEAGHVVADDVTAFRRLLSCAQATGIVVGLVLLFIGGLMVWFRVQVSQPFVSLAGLLCASGFLCFVTWSALVTSRELSADAFAATMTSRQKVSAFLSSHHDDQSRSVFRRVWRALIQPERRFRSTVPGLDGDLGVRIELMLGTSLGTSAIMITYFVAGLQLYGLMLSGVIFFLVMSLAYLTIGYEFAWWRARRARGVAGLWRQALTGLRVAGSAWCVMILNAVAAQLAAGRFLDADPWRAVVKNVDFAVLLLAIPIFAWASASTGLLFDVAYRKNVSRPHLGSGVAATIVTVLVCAVAVVAWSTVGSAANMPMAALKFLILVCVFLLSQTLVAQFVVGRRLRRG
jgi:Zn-dependent protease with chaperone function